MQGHMPRDHTGEETKRYYGIRAVAEIPSHYRPNKLDLEEFHERSEACIPIIPLGSLAVVRESIAQVNKLTISRNDKGQVSQALAWDDLTGMRLDGNKVMEAREKEVKYVRGKQVWKKITRKEAQAKGWKIIKTR